MQLERERNQRAARRRQARNTFLGWVAGLVGVPAIAAAIIFGGFYLDENDYAGFERSGAEFQATEALTSQFGVESTEKGTFRGRPAWIVTYSAPDKEKVCVYVWKTDTAINYEVEGC